MAAVAAAGLVGDSYPSAIRMAAGRGQNIGAEARQPEHLLCEGAAHSSKEIACATVQHIYAVYG